MNNFVLIWRLISRKGGKRNFKWGLLLPVIGVFLGTLIVSLTISIMEGLEHKIFTSISTFSSPAYFNVKKEDIHKYSTLLNNLNIKNEKSISRKAIVHTGENFRLLNVIGTNSELYFPNQIHNNYTKSNNNTNEIVIGELLSLKLGVDVGNEIFIIAPLDINLATSIPKKEKFKIVNIFTHDVKDYENNTIFIPYSIAENMFPYSSEYSIKLENKLSENQLKLIELEELKSKYGTWEEGNIDFINAMKLEKIAYSIFGFLIIIISAFTLLAMMSMSTIHKRKEIGILRTIGFDSFHIANIFYLQSILTSIIGSIAGVTTTYYLIFLNMKYDILVNVISSFPFKEFPLLLSLNNCILIVLISCLIMICSSLYPARLIKNMGIVRAIENNL